MLFTEKSPTHPPLIGLPIEEKAPITFIGTINFDDILCFTDVLCVPSFNANLLSVSRLTTSLNYCVLVFPTFCYVQDLRTKKMIGLGKKHGNLHYFDQQRLASQLYFSSTYRVFTSHNLWHLRLGHPSNANLRSLSKHFSYFSLPMHVCDFFSFVKQTRLPFPSNSIKALYFLM